MVVHARSSWSRYFCHNRDAATQKVLTIESIHSNLNVRLTFIVGEKKQSCNLVPFGWPGRVEALTPSPFFVNASQTCFTVVAIGRFFRKSLGGSMAKKVEAAPTEEKPLKR